MTKHSIPDAALSQHVAIVAQTGAGKSYATRSIVEGLLDDGRRVCILDYTGVWWGLRSSATGKSSGYPVVIFGGDHADVPLNEQAADVVAKFVATGEVPVIIDLDGMTVGAQQRFVTAFLEELYRLNSRPLHLVIEEIDEFAPQTGAKGTERLIGATARIFQRGRAKGFRAIAITQRPANTHKRVLAQCKTLIALRLVHPRDRAAIEDWISGHAADDAKAAEIMAELAGLQVGEGFVWAPEQRILERVKFPRIKTFDSMKAPEDGDEAEPSRWADVDLDVIRSKMGDLVAEAKANDPKLLKAEIADLKRQMTAASAAAAKAGQTPDPKAIETAEERGYERAKKELAAAADRELLDRQAAFLLRIGAAVGPLMDLLKEETRLAKPHVAKQLTFMPTPPVGRERPATSGNGAARGAGYAPPPPVRAPNSSQIAAVNDGALTRPQQRILTSLAFWHSINHDGPSREQVAAVAGYRPGSGGYNNLLGGLKSAGLIDYPSTGRVALTETGRESAVSMDMVDARAMLLSVLTGPQKRLVDAAIGAGELAREELAARTDYSVGSGGFNNLIGSLNTLTVFTKPGSGKVALSDWAAELLS